MKIKKIGVVNRVISPTECQHVSISSDSIYDSIAYDPVKTRLAELEAEAEETANCKAQSQTLSLIYSSTFACDSDNTIFT